MYLKLLRQSKKMTQEDLASRLNISQAQLSRVEEHRTILRIDQLAELKHILKLTHDQLDKILDEALKHKRPQRKRSR